MGDNFKTMDEKKIGGYIPIITIIIILLSALHQIVYYNYFEVPITYFLSFSDLGFLISNDLIQIGLLLIFYYSYIRYLHIVNAKKELEKTNNKKISETNNKGESKSKYEFLKPIKNYKHTSKSLFVILYIAWLLPIILLYFFASNPVFKKASLLLGLIAIFHAFYYDITLRWFLISRSYSYKTVITSLIIAGCLSLYSLIIANDIVNTTKNYTIGTIVKTRDTTYTSNDSLIFLGKSNNYVFFYNTKDTTSLIVPLDDLISIKYKNRNKKK